MALGGAAIAATVNLTNAIGKYFSEESSSPTPAAGGSGGEEKAVPSNDAIVDAVGQSGATVTPHPTKTGEGVAIQFPTGDKLDIRVENHPLTKGGPAVPHANVEIWKADGSHVNKHIEP